MNNSFEMRTKVYYAPSMGKKIWKLLLNIGYWICAVAVGISALLALLMGDWPILLGLLQPMIILTMLLIMFNNRAKNIVHFEEAMVNGTITEQQIVLYYTQLSMNRKKWEQVTYKMSPSSIRTLEFSSQLGYLKISAYVTKQIEGKSEIQHSDEHYLYIEPQKEKEIIKYFSDVTKVPISYIDEA